MRLLVRRSFSEGGTFQVPFTRLSPSFQAPFMCQKAVKGPENKGDSGGPVRFGGKDKYMCFCACSRSGICRGGS